MKPKPIWRSYLQEAAEYAAVSLTAIPTEARDYWRQEAERLLRMAHEEWRAAR